MTFSDYISDFNRRALLAKAVGTSGLYLWQCATHWRGRNAGPKLAEKIHKASAKIGPESICLHSIRPDMWAEGAELSTRKPRRTARKAA